MTKRKFKDTSPTCRGFKRDCLATCSIPSLRHGLFPYCTDCIDLIKCDESNDNSRKNARRLLTTHNEPFRIEKMKCNTCNEKKSPGEFSLDLYSKSEL